MILLQLNQQTAYSQNGKESSLLEALYNCDSYSLQLEKQVYKHTKQIEFLRTNLKVCDISDSTKSETITVILKEKDGYKSALDLYIKKEEVNVKTINSLQKKVKNRWIFILLGLGTGIIISRK